MVHEWKANSVLLWLASIVVKRLRDLPRELRIANGSLQWMGDWTSPAWSEWILSPARDLHEALFEPIPNSFLPSERARRQGERRAIEDWVSRLDRWRLHASHDHAWTDEQRENWKQGLHSLVVFFVGSSFFWWRLKRKTVESTRVFWRWCRLKLLRFPIDKVHHIR